MPALEGSNVKVYISDDDMCTTQKLNLARVQKWLEANGCTIVESPVASDRVMAMTCNGWSLLEDKSFERIETLGRDHGSKMLVVGCVVDAHPEKVANVWSGPTVKTRSEAPLSFAGIEDYFPDFDISLESIPAQSEFRREEDYRDTSKVRKFVNIAEGCSFACSFCHHKPGLGPRRSRPLSEIMEQVASFENEPVDVVHLMGMETGLWGIEFGQGYPDLLEAVLERNDGFEIHIAQFQPHGLKMHGERLSGLMSQRRVTDIQIPIQSTSDRIMKMMNRKNHAEAISEHLKFIRRNNPRVVLRTDVIVGWPTETPEERHASLQFAAEHFDEVAVYAIELNPDLPAWQYHEEAFSAEELDRIVASSKAFLSERGISSHSGQQDDASMASAEKARMELRDARSSSCDTAAQGETFIPIDSLQTR